MIAFMSCQVFFPDYAADTLVFSHLDSVKVFFAGMHFKFLSKSTGLVVDHENIIRLTI